MWSEDNGGQSSGNLLPLLLFHPFPCRAIVAPTRFERLSSRLLLQLQPSGFDSPLLLPRDSFNKLKEKRQHNCAARFLAIFLEGGGGREKNGFKLNATSEGL